MQNVLQKTARTVWKGHRKSIYECLKEHGWQTDEELQSLLLLTRLDMELVQYAMEDRSEDKTRCNHDDEAGEYGVAAREDFTRLGLEFDGRPHARKDHRRIQKGVREWHALKVSVPSYADC